MAAHMAYNKGITHNNANSQAPSTFNLSLKKLAIIFIDNGPFYLKQKTDLLRLSKVTKLKQHLMS